MASKLFKDNFGELIARNVGDAEKAISTESDNYILNVNEEEFIEHVSQLAKFNPPIIHWEDVSVDYYEKDFLEYEPYGRNRDQQFVMKRQVFRYFLPITGDRTLLYYQKANTMILDGFSEEGVFKDGCLVIEIVQRGTEIEAVQNQYLKTKEGMLYRYKGLIEDINNFNESIASHVRNKFNERKDRILHQKNQLAALGIPIRQTNTSSTFSIPKPQLRQKIVIKKPVVNEKGFTPEPTLEDSEYKVILKYIDDIGRNFERMPSTSKGKREEDLRDHILLILDPHFELGSATGETFNKKGKTDILLNYNGHAVFIAECKYWTGEKGFIETIDQLLSYLTWRNSKASVIMFVKQNDFTSVVQKAVEATKKHPNYLSEVGKSNESWYNFRFHLNDDPNRELKLAVQLYHVPKN